MGCRGAEENASCGGGGSTPLNLVAARSAAPPSSGAATPSAFAFIIIIVPLNFPEETDFKGDAQLEHARASSPFWVPQLGQNTGSSDRPAA